MQWNEKGMVMRRQELRRVRFTTLLASGCTIKSLAQHTYTHTHILLNNRHLTTIGTRPYSQHPPLTFIVTGKCVQVPF